MTVSLFSKKLCAFVAQPTTRDQQDKLWQRIASLCLHRSFRDQIAERSFLYPVTIRHRILEGEYADVEESVEKPEPFGGSTKQLIRDIARTVHVTVKRFDYNGMLPFLDLLDQLARGKTFRETCMGDREEEHGSTCVGISRAIIKALKETHGVEGMLAFRLKEGEAAYDHCAVIIECADGFVFIESTSPHNKIVSVPFNSELVLPDASYIIGGDRGSSMPVIFQCQDGDHEYLVDIGNGADLVLKSYMMQKQMIPLVAYYSQGMVGRYVGIDMTKSEVLLKNKGNFTGGTVRITFQEILQKLEVFYRTLHEFMQPTDFFGSSLRFHTSPEVAYSQLRRLIDYADVMKSLFIEAHPHAIRIA